MLGDSRIAYFQSHLWDVHRQVGSPIQEVKQKSAWASTGDNEGRQPITVTIPLFWFTLWSFNIAIEHGHL